MTDTAAPSQGLNVTVEELQSVYNEIDALDSQIAAASGSDAMGKRAYLNSLFNERQPSLQPFIDQVIMHLTTQLSDDPESLAAAVNGLDRAISDAFGKQVDELATKFVEANKTEAPAVSDEELSNLTNAARELRKRYNALRGVLDMFGFDVSSVPEPKKLSGARGPRGPRTLSNFNYFVDGKPRTESQNSLSSISNTVFKDTPFREAKALREELARQGLDLQNPPEEWAYDVVLDGDKKVKISAVKSAEKDEYVKSDDDDETGSNE